MQVAQYLFQSPSTSSVQVGKLDPNSVKDASSKSSESLPKAVLDETETKAQNFEQAQKQVVKPTVTAKEIDLYV